MPKKKFILFAAVVSISALTLLAGCAGESDTVIPKSISVSLPVVVTGTLMPQILDTYPANGDTNIPADADIILVFSKPVARATIAANVVITGPTTFSIPLPVISDDKTIIIQPTLSLAWGAGYTVNLGLGITDPDGNPLYAAYSFSFTVAANPALSLVPRVIAAARYPASGAVNVSRNQGYVEVTFTKDINAATVDAASFVIAPNLASGAPSQRSNRTFRLPLNQLNYSTSYMVALNGAIQDDTDGTALDLDGNHTWTFTTEIDPALVALSIEDIWVDSAATTGALVYFTTSKGFSSSRSYVQTGTVSATYTLNHNEGVAPDNPLHSILLAGLSPGTLYYYRGWLDVDASGTVNAGDAVSAEYSFRTANTDTVNSPLSDALADQNGLVLVQTINTGSYAFWVSGGGDIYGQFFDETPGAPQWGAGGTAISTPGVQDGITAITDGFTDAVLVYKEGNNLYSKMIYNNPGPPPPPAVGFRWPGDGASSGVQGVNLGLTIKAGSKYSACLVHERPAILTSGDADMPDDGVAANLLYDADVNFSVYSGWLNAGDLLLTNTVGIVWDNYIIANQGGTPFDLFPFIIKSSGVTNLGLFTSYYIADTASTVTQADGAADSVTISNELRSTTNANFLSVAAGDIVRNTVDNEWGLASAPGEWIGPYYRIQIDRNLTNLADGKNFTIYRYHAGPFTSELSANPLWDTAPATLFNPGTTVLAGDIVVNEKTNAAAAAYAAVAAINPARDTDYALNLSADIMDHTDIYSILRMPAVATIRGVGYNTDLGVNDYQLHDTWANFTVWPVNPGDVVFNIDAVPVLSAMVVTRDSATQLTLSADIFNGANHKYIVFAKRGFLVTYVDAGDFIRARAFNNADGTPLGADFNVCTSGVNSNPVAVSDGAGNAIIFYQKGVDIYAKKVSAKGEFFTAWGVNADEASDAGILKLAGYAIVHALPDRAIGRTGGAYLLAVNTAGTNFTILRINGDTGANIAGWPIAAVPGDSPRIAVDYITGGADSNVIVTYRAPNAGYFHIRAAGYTSAGGVYFAPLLVTSDTALYNCVLPVITMADNAAGADMFYVSWFDGRFFNPSGYSIFAQSYTSVPAVRWAVNGIYISAPASMGYDNPLYMRLLFVDDNTGTPFGVMPVWLDYRNKGVTGTDIYYQRVRDDNTLF